MNGKELTKQETALFRAIERKNIEKVRRALAQAANPNAAEWSDYVGNTTVLMYAAGCQFPEAVECLLQAGADVNAKQVAGLGGHGGRTALHHALDGSDPTQPRIAQEADLKQRGSVVKLLLEAGADPNAVDEMGVSPLYDSVQSGYVEIACQLITAGGDPHGKDGSLPPLPGAANGRSLEAVKLLLTHGVPVDAASSKGVTGLMAASYRGAEGIVEFLLKEGADPNRQAHDGHTPLIRAALYARDAFVNDEHELALRMVKRLLDAGADPNARNKEGQSALDIAKDARSPLVADYLKQVMGSKSKRKSWG